jgi:hypothetical protein
LAGIDPDDAFSSVPYEKGFYLIYYLRNLVGKAPFDAFFHDYIQVGVHTLKCLCAMAAGLKGYGLQVFKYRSITSEDFKNYFIAYFTEGRHTLPRVSHSGVPPVHNGSTGSSNPSDIPALAAKVCYTVCEVPSAGVDEASESEARKHAIDVSAVDWDAWFTGVGTPPVKNRYDASARSRVDEYASLWVSNPSAAAASAAEATSSWNSLHWIAFLEKLLALSGEYATQTPAAIIDPAILQAIDERFKLSASRNAEFRLMWSQLAVRSGIVDRLPDVLAFLAEQGRMKASYHFSWSS